tara:strand:- start:767 stop:1012 length:246 start_codon:yes stop_codon:yes gene_type:complete
MNFQDEMDKLFNHAQDKFAERISALLRSINDKEKSFEALTNMENEPSIDILKRINKIAIAKEDYETCEALKLYSKNRGIKL